MRKQCPSDSKYILRSPRFNEEYILRISNLLPKKYYLKNESEALEIVEFINNYFLYSVKSVLKEGIF